MKTKNILFGSTLLAAAAMSFCTTSANAATLTWAGTDDNSSWDYTSENWSGGDDGKFVSGDNAIFDGTADSSEVSIEEAITAGTITISSGSYTFTFSNSGSVSATSLTINSGASLEITGTGKFTAGSSSSTIDGSLTISGGTTKFGDLVYVGREGKGTLTISGGTTTFGSSVFVGDSGTGSLTVSGGETTFSGNVYLGYYDGSSGIMEISGGETTFSVRVCIGNNSGSSGTLTITGGKTTFGGSVFVGDSGTGSLTVSGGETTFSSALGVYVGYYGTGTMEISGGKTTFGSTVYVGDQEDSIGTLAITGGETKFKSTVYLGFHSDSSGKLTISNSKTTFGDIVHVGNYGNGTTEITGGETTFEKAVYLGYYDGSSGTMEISGGKTTFGYRVYVGNSGTGELTISGDAETTFSTVYIGNNSGSSGTLTITGGKTTFNGQYTYVGYGGTGSLTITGGETTFSSIVYLGYNSGSSGTLTIGSVDGTGGTTKFEDTVYVGREGKGTLTITGGETTFEKAVYLGYYDGSSGTMEISGGTTKFGDLVYVGRNGTGELTISGGDVAFSNSVTVAEGSSLSLTGGTITLSGAISNSGTVTVNNDVVFALDNLTASNNTYTLISGGTINGWNSLTKSNFSLNGKGLGRSTVNVETTAGQVTVTFVEAANLVWNGTETDNVWTNNGKNIWLLDDGSPDAFVENDNVTFGTDGEKSVTIIGKIEAGSVTVTDSSSYTFTFSEDSSLTADSLTITEGASAELKDGSTTIEGAVTIDGSGSLSISGGSTTVTGSATVSTGSTLTVSDSGSLEITGGLTSAGTISVSDSASLSLSGTIDLSSAISNSGTVTVSDNVVFVLDDLTSVDGTYTLISGGTIEGWDTLDESNFSLNGSTVTVDVSIAGQVTIIIEGDIGDLLWNGTASSNVWTNDGEEIWLNGEDSDAFVAGDNVTFGSDGTKSVSIVGAIEAGSVTVTGNGYTFSFSEDSSVTADSLTIDEGASLKMAGSGELTTDFATISGTLEISSGEATITTVEVSSEGTLKVSGGTTTADSIEVEGSLELSGGELTVKTITLSDGSSGSFSGGILNISEITGDGSLSFGNGLTVNLYDTTSLSLTSDITLSGSVTFNAEEGESIELSGTLSGSGKLVKDGEGTLTVSGEENAYTGGTTISSGTIVAQSENALGTGSISIDEGATLEIPTSREFTNATSGNGTLSIASGATVSFGSNVGVKTVEVTSGATLSGATTLTHSNAQLVLAGELALDASAGEQVSFTNGGTVILEDSATLNLSGVSPTSVRPLSSSSEIGPGSNITIFSGATVEGDIEAFLAKDSTLSDLSSDYAIVYDHSKGLSVMILESGNVSSITSGVKLHEGIGSSFISAIISDDDLDFGTGIKSSDDLQSLSNPIVKALATGNISEASKMMDALAPNDYAAMVAMPTTSFYNDVKAIDNRLAARRGPLDENARWEFFAQAQGTFIENDDANDTQTFDFDLYGVLAGADYRVNEGLTVGVTVGYDYGKADIHNSGGKIESDDVRITVFAGQQIGEMFFVNAGAQVGYGHYEAKRKTAYGNANGDTDGWNAGLFADVGMMLTLSEELKIAARPYVGLAYLHSEVGSFDDNIFDVDDFHGDSLRASIGCGLFWGFDLAEAAWAVGLDASYSHDFCGDEVDIDATYMGTGKDFGITAKALSKDIFSLGPVVSVGITKSIDIFAGYAFQAGTDSSTGHNVNAGLKVTF